MSSKKKQSRKTRPKSDEPESEHRAPSGRGGAAMGRTVGLPFGGARPRKRKSSEQRGGSKAK